MLMAMSVVQDRSGFSFLAPPVYQYICGVDIPRISIADEDVPDYDVRKIIEEVHEHPILSWELGCIYTCSLLMHIVHVPTH